MLPYLQMAAGFEYSAGDRPRDRFRNFTICPEKTTDLYGSHLHLKNVSLFSHHLVEHGIHEEAEE